MKKEPIEQIINALVLFGLPEEHRGNISRVTINAKYAYVTVYVMKNGKPALDSTFTKPLTKRIRLNVYPGPAL